MQENKESGNFGALEKNSSNLHKDGIEENMQIRTEAAGSDLHKVNDSEDKSGVKVETLVSTKDKKESIIKKKFDEKESEKTKSAILDEISLKKVVKFDLESGKEILDNCIEDNIKVSTDCAQNTFFSAKSVDNNAELTTINDDLKGKVKSCTVSSGSKIHDAVVQVEDIFGLKHKSKSLELASEIEKRKLCSKKLKLENLVSGLNSQKVGTEDDKDRNLTCQTVVFSNLWFCLKYQACFMQSLYTFNSFKNHDNVLVVLVKIQHFLLKTWK